MREHDHIFLGLTETEELRIRYVLDRFGQEPGHNPFLVVKDGAGYRAGRQLQLVGRMFAGTFDDLEWVVWAHFEEQYGPAGTLLYSSPLR